MRLPRHPDRHRHTRTSTMRRRTTHIHTHTPFRPTRRRSSCCCCCYDSRPQTADTHTWARARHRLRYYLGISFRSLRSSISPSQFTDSVIHLFFASCRMCASCTHTTPSTSLTYTDAHIRRAVSHRYRAFRRKTRSKHEFPTHTRRAPSHHYVFRPNKFVRRV